MKILVTGAAGLVGSALKTTEHGEDEFVFHCRNDCDLSRDIDQIKKYLTQHSPDCVIHLAAKVGGLYANTANNVDFLNENLKINHNVLQACADSGVKKVISCLSTCIFPDNTSYPIDETMIHNGKPHESNEGYAFAKRMLEVSSRLYSKKYGVTYTCVIPTNIFGPNDNFDIENGHVIPALVHKSVLAKKENRALCVRGNGTALRQFIYSKDLAKLLVWACHAYDSLDPIILCDEHEYSIRHVAETIRDAVHKSQAVHFDPQYSEGQHKKTASSSKLRALNPTFKFTPFEEAIRQTCKWFEKHMLDARTAERELTKVALITGISGQDGSYLAEFLLTKNYTVHGIIRRHSTIHLPNLQDIRNQITLHYGDIQDTGNLGQILHQLKHFDVVEVYNLCAMSHVKVSFDKPSYTLNADGLGVVNLLECIRLCGFTEKIRFYQASTSEMFGEVVESPQSENTPFRPCSPYACAKVYGHYICRNYRESYGMFACSGILFNHESKRRGPTFVTQKICNSVKNIRDGKETCFNIGNLDALRDWGHAKEYVEAMWMMLQHHKADDYVVATGEMHSVREFIEVAFSKINIVIRWMTDEKYERGVDQDNITRVKVDPAFFRPCEVKELLGDCSKINKILNWKSNTTFRALVEDMMMS